MTDHQGNVSAAHRHVFLGADHARSERRTWAVIWLCAAMMIAEIVGGLMFGSIALVADGIHMSTHAGALLLAALAYSFARRYADNPRFSFGTGKLGDLAGYTSAIILAMIALLIGYEAISRIFDPVPIRFAEAIAIACFGLAVNIASAFILGGGLPHGHAHGPVHGHGHAHGHGHEHGHAHPAHGSGHDDVNGSGGHEHAGESVARDYNMQAAVVHVIADAAVSVLVIVGLLAALAFGWLWTDPLAGMIGAAVTASWAYGLVRNSGAILLDMTPDTGMEARIRAAVETEGDALADLHLWRLGPGHLGAIVSVVTTRDRDPDYYRARLARFRDLSHLTVEVKVAR